MNLNKIFACGMLLGLLTAVSFAQHQRIAGGGTMPGAHLPNTIHSGGVLGAPDATTLGKGSVTSGGQTSGVFTPNATTTPSAKTVSPNANLDPNASTISPHARTVDPNANTTPERVTIPDDAH